jgi:rhodanese-related sulfurtransferase
MTASSLGLKRWLAIGLGSLTLTLASMSLGLLAEQRAAEPLALLTPWHIDPALPIVSPDRAHELYDTATAAFVDARTSQEFGREHVPFASSLPLASLEDGINRLDGVLAHAKAIVVYCDGPTCGASFEVARELVRSGYAPVYVLYEGLPGWKRAGYPVESGEVAP